MVMAMEDWMHKVEATPALVIDLPTVQRNLRRMSGYTWAHGIGLRPHTKTHKSLQMAQMQLDAGAVGLTTAKVGEAEVMSRQGRDILIAYPAIDRASMQPHRRAGAIDDDSRGDGFIKRNRGDRRCGAGRRVKSRRLVDIDVGFHRTGVQSAADSWRWQEISRRPSLRLDGIFFYPGHVWSPANQQADELQAIDAILAEAIELWKKSGLEAAIVSGGSTPTAYQSHLIPSQTEIRPGTYIYNDMNTFRAGFCKLEDIAASIVCTIVSTTVPEKTVIDAGTKTLTSDRNVKFPDTGFGYVVESPDDKIVRLSEEHGEVDAGREAHRLELGQRVRIIPNHICPCVNLLDRVWLKHEDGRLEPLSVDGGEIVMNAKLSGVLPVFQTPYHEDESIDADTLAREIAWLYDCGADGIVMAMVSEILRLSSEERRELAELRRANSDGSAGWW